MTTDRYAKLTTCWLGVAHFAWSASTLQGQTVEPPWRNKEQIEQVESWLTTDPAAFAPLIDNRADWQELAKQPEFEAMLITAREEATKPLPVLTEELYLNFTRTGKRAPFETPHKAIESRLQTLVLAECLENQGRFLHAIEDIVRTVCGWRTWARPAHDKDLSKFRGDNRSIDLASARMAFTMAYTYRVLNQRLAPEISELIQDRLKFFVFDSFDAFIDNDDPQGNWWLDRKFNWNAVCIGQTVGAAVLAELPRERLAAYILMAQNKMEDIYLQGFTADGYCSEGVGYWNYGYGRFLVLCEILWQATDGKINLLRSNQARAAANYAWRIEVDRGHYPSFADSKPGSEPFWLYKSYLANRISPLAASLPKSSMPSTHNIVGTFDALVALAPQVSRNRQPASDRADRDLKLRDLFENAGVYVLRPQPTSAARLAVALKAGHNDEHHNHNDVGTFSVFVNGNETLVDPGAEIYSLRTFSPQRYESDLINSCGHSVPRVAGELQRTGVEAQGKVIATSFSDLEDRVVIDLSAAYDVPQLKSLQRSFFYRRDNPSLTITDEVHFLEPAEFETALITRDSWTQLDDQTLRIGEGDSALEVIIRTPTSVAIDGKALTAKPYSAVRPQRIAIRVPHRVKHGKIELVIKLPKMPDTSISE